MIPGSLSLSRAIDRISMLVRMTELDHMSSVKMATIEIELHTAVTMEMADSLLQLLSDGLINKVSDVGIYDVMLCHCNITKPCRLAYLINILVYSSRHHGNTRCGYYYNHIVMIR